MAERQTLVSTGTSDAVRFGGFRDSNATITYTISGISGSLVASIEGRIGENGDWVNLDPNGSTTQTSDGTYGFEKLEVAYDYVRFNWESGTATSIVVNYGFNS